MKHLRLVNGENEITIPEGGMPDLFVCAKEGYKLEEVTVNGVQVENTESIPVTADMVLSITKSKIEVKEESGIKMGNRRESSNLAPGIYIVNGKKAVIK